METTEDQREQRREGLELKSFESCDLKRAKGWRICETQYFAKCKFSEIEGSEMQQWKRVCRLLKTKWRR